MMRSRPLSFRLILAAMAIALMVAALSGCARSKPVGAPDGFNPKMTIDVDQAAAKEYQTEVDTGHNPWRLDAAQVAATTLEGQMIPGGGGPVHKVPVEAFKELANDGVYAIYEVTDAASPWAKIYLRKPVNQDNTGIWMVVGYDPRGAGSSAQSLADNRGAYLFDLAIANRFDYVPEFEQGKAPSQSPDYLYYAFILNLDKWKSGDKFLPEDYVEDVITSHFEVDADAIVHTASRDWNFDGKVYTVARPSSYAYEPIYGLKEFASYEQGDRTVYDVVLDQYSFDEFAYESPFEYALPGGANSGSFSPSMQSVIDQKGEQIRSGELRVWEAIREMIAEGDTGGFVANSTERFKFYLGEDRKTVVFLEHVVE